LLGSMNVQEIVKCARSLEEFAPDYAQVLEELAGLLVRVAMKQAVSDFEGDDLYAPELLERLAKALSPEDLQLFYQTAITGRRDLALAPDPRTGFEMTLVRMIAFRPANDAGFAQPPTGGAGGAVTRGGGGAGHAGAQGSAGPQGAHGGAMGSSAGAAGAQGTTWSGQSGTSTAASPGVSIPGGASAGGAAAARAAARAAAQAGLQSGSARATPASQPTPASNPAPATGTLPASDSSSSGNATSAISGTDHRQASASQAGHAAAARVAHSGPVPANAPLTNGTAPDAPSNASASASAPGPASTSTSAVAPGSGDASWLIILNQIDLQGAPRQLANHCALLGHQPGLVRLAIDPSVKFVRTTSQEEKLAQALSRYYGETVRLEISTATGEIDTPARAEVRASQQELESARQSMETDPAVQGLRERFGATLLSDTVRPIK
jgi:DNA polymerase III subunit gamma/tau